MDTSPNPLADFPPESFTVLAFCEACGRSAAVDRSRLPPGLSSQSLSPHLRCRECGTRSATIRIVYTGAGGFHVGAHYGGLDDEGVAPSPPLTD